MSNLTNYGAAAVRGGTALPQTFYVKFHTGDPGADGTANAAVETTRKAITLETDPNTAHSESNDAGASWTALAATETVRYVTLWDAVTAGNPWAVGAMVPVIELTLSGNADIVANAILITLVPWGV